MLYMFLFLFGFLLCNLLFDDKTNYIIVYALSLPALSFGRHQLPVLSYVLSISNMSSQMCVLLNFIFSNCTNSCIYYIPRRVLAQMSLFI